MELVVLREAMNFAEGRSRDNQRRDRDPTINLKFPA